MPMPRSTIEREPSTTGRFDQLTLPQLRERTSVKWRAYADDVLPVWVAEMDVLLAEPIVAAVGDALRRGDTGYACGSGYAEALAAVAEQRWGWTLEPARARSVPDVMVGAVEVLRVLTAPGDAVVVNPPVYPPFFAFLRHADRRVVEVPLTPDQRLDLDGLADAFARPEVTGSLLCSPHNPTGTVHTADELRVVATLADQHGVRVVADEIHALLTLPDRRPFVPWLSLPEAQRGVALHSASKAWNLAGLKAAVAIGGEAAADDLARIPEEVGHGVSHLGVIAHTAALREGGTWLDEVRGELAATQQRLVDLLAEHLPEVRYRPGDATYLAWLDCRALGLGDDPAAAFLEHGRVALTSGLGFGAGGRGYARFNHATSGGLLEEAVRRMAATVDRTRPSTQPSSS
jgi:cysteine-S-conjugate beta-lyase